MDREVEHVDEDDAPARPRSRRRSTFTRPPATEVSNYSDISPQNEIILRPSTSASPIYPNNVNELDLSKEKEQEFNEWQAICRFCFKTFEAGNMFKIKCRCPDTLTHKECVLKWSGVKGNNICDTCEQEIQSFSVDWHVMVENEKTLSQGKNCTSSKKKRKNCTIR